MGPLRRIAMHRASPALAVALFGYAAPGLAAVAASWLFFGNMAIYLLVALLPPGLLLALHRAGTGPRDHVTGLPLRAAAVQHLQRLMAGLPAHDSRCGALLIEIDNFIAVEETLDHAGTGAVLSACAGRLRQIMEPGDLLCRLDGPAFALVPGLARDIGLEAAMRLAGRMQHVLTAPIAVGPANVLLTASAGFALASNVEERGAEAVMQAARAALIEAQRSGPGAVRSWSAAMKRRAALRNGLAGEVAGALERGEICAYFQPQIATRDGALSGIETLARWHHPARGLIAPAEFLPAVEQSGLMARLGEHMVRQALAALRDWDGAGLGVPRIGVNFSGRELADPLLVGKIAFELDRFGIAPGRLVVEVLETVVAGRAEDNVIRNLSGLARLGCCLDLDDFGTGHASITSIRRFSIARIKIDRSFVCHIDEDEEQQKMVSAILTMSERLGLDTLAEGVEHEAEFRMLADLGCAHVQGYHIARPMARAQTEIWLAARAGAAGAAAGRGGVDSGGAGPRQGVAPAEAPRPDKGRPPRDRQRKAG